MRYKTKNITESERERFYYHLQRKNRSSLRWLSHMFENHEVMSSIHNVACGLKESEISFNKDTWKSGFEPKPC